MTGEREEYVIERWPAQDDIVYGDPLRVEVPHNVGDQPRAGYDRDFEPALPGGPANGAAGLPCEDRHGPALVGARGDGYLEVIPADTRLSSAAVPSAVTRPWSMTAIRSASRSASSRYWVVSSTVTPSSASSVRMMPHMTSRLRGSSPVVGSSRNSTLGRPIRLAARSRRRRIPPE